VTPPLERRAARPTAEVNSLLSRKGNSRAHERPNANRRGGFHVWALDVRMLWWLLARARSDRVHTEATPRRETIVGGMRELFDARQKCRGPMDPPATPPARRA
jgi:hypothetical protein